MISTGACMKAARRILRAIRGHEPDPMEIILAATIIAKEDEIERSQRDAAPALSVIKGGKS